LLSADPQKRSAQHLRQHAGWLTGHDREVEERARALADAPPETEHFFLAAAPLLPIETEPSGSSHRTR
jgi:hypothetical protein